MNTEENNLQDLDVDVTPVGGDREMRCRVTVRRGEEVIYTDTLKIDSSKSRAAFLNVVEKLTETRDVAFDRDRCEQALMQHVVNPPPEDNGNSEPEVIDYRQVLDTFGIDVLGEQDDQSIICWMRNTGKRWTIKSPSNWKGEEMLQAMGEDAAAHLWREGGTAPEGTYTPKELREAIALAAASSQRIAANKLVGQGVSKHEDRLLLVNGGEACLYDGSDFELLSQPRLGDKIIDFNTGKNWFPGMVEAVRQVDKTKANQALMELEGIFGNWRWTHNSDPEVVAGLLAATFVQACWTWRPLVSIIGASDSGKSTLLQDVLVPVFGSWCIAADRSTEAGLRQAIGCDTAPVVIDEFDKYKQRQQVLELFRTSSRGGSILRGTQDQAGQRFGVKHLAWFAAIESGDLWGQDRNRFVRLELLPPENRGGLVLPGPSELSSLGSRLAAAAIWAAPSAVSLADAIKNERIEGVHGRLVESFAVSAAMSTVLKEGRGVGKEAARETLRRMLHQRGVVTSQGERDELQLLTDILAANVRVPQDRHDDERGIVYVERSVGQLLSPLRRGGSRTPMLPVNEEGLKVLEAKGIKLVRARGGNESRLFIVSNTVREQLLARTRWADTQIEQLLTRITGARREQQRVGSNRSRGISLPWPGCLDEIDGEDNGGTT